MLKQKGLIASHLPQKRGNGVRIAQVCPWFYPYVGGVPTHVREIAKRLVRRGLTVDVLTTDPSGLLAKEEVVDEINIKRFRSWDPNGYYSFSPSLREYLRRNSSAYDIVHAHDCHSFPALFAAHVRNAKALVLTPQYHTIDRSLVRIAHRLIFSLLLHEFDKTLCVSEYERNLLVRDFRIGCDKVIVVPNGLDLIELSKYRWRGSCDRMKITFSGRLVRQKNVEALVESMEMLRRQYGIIAELSVIGEGPRGARIGELARRLGIQEQIVVRGWLPRARYLEELVSSNLFVMPCEYETYGIAAAEAIVLGVPTLVADSGALSEYVRNGLALGIDIPITPERITAALYRALTQQVVGPYRRRECFLTWDDVVERVLGVYSELSHR
jgi:glycosyltransferase involved in cell wall biosynthesis